MKSPNAADGDGGAVADQAADERALAAVLEEAVDGVRQELVRAEDVAEPALVVLVAGDQARRDRAALGFAEEGRRARRHAFDRPRATLDLFDVDAGMQVFRHGDSPRSRQRSYAACSTMIIRDVDPSLIPAPRP